MPKKQGEEVKDLRDFVYELRRFYARGRGYELLDFEMKVATIAEETLGTPCYFNWEKEKVLFEEALIDGILYIQHREDVLVCNDEKEILVRHKVYVVECDRSTLCFMGWAPIELDEVMLHG